MQESRRRRHYQYASAPNDFVNLLLFVLLFALMVGVAYFGMHHALALPSNLSTSLFNIKGLKGG